MNNIRKIKIKNLYIGGDAPITVQSMCNTKTDNIEATINQIAELEKAGCDIVRVAVNTKSAGLAVSEIVKCINIPLVADIHFDYKLALLSAENGASKIRINPGNIGSEANVKYVADFLKERGIPIRIGVNAGSLEKEFNHLNKSEAMVESALKHIKILEKANFYDTIISIKSSNVKDMINANKALSKVCDYPLHLGVTEAGTFRRGLIKSSVGIGSLLLDSVGDTIRISLTDNPIEEVIAGKMLLESIGLSKSGIEIISCPTCARTNISVQKIAEELEKQTLSLSTKKPIKIAVMGCVVNGIGEASDASFGVAGGGNDQSAIFKGGKVLKTVNNKDILSELLMLLQEEINE